MRSQCDRMGDVPRGLGSESNQPKSVAEQSQRLDLTIKRRCAVKSCVGVEIGEKRSAVLSAVGHELSLLSAKYSPVVSILGDIRRPLYTQATVIYFCNVIFDLQMQGRVIDTMLKTCPSLR